MTRSRVLLDANALMMPVEVGVRVFDELDRLLGAQSEREPRSRPAGSARAEDRPGRAAETVGTAGGVGDTGDRGTIENTADSGIDGVTLLVPEAVLDELDRLSGGHGTEGIAASVGADLARERCRVLAHDAAYADDAIHELATDRRAVIDYVVTNDRDLQERLGVQDVPVICLRGHNQLTIQES